MLYLTAVHTVGHCVCVARRVYPAAAGPTLCAMIATPIADLVLVRSLCNRLHGCDLITIDSAHVVPCPQLAWVHP
jgi:hypothetical protein